MDISIVIPFLNESENVDFLFESIENYLTSRTEKVEVIFVDDGSTDNSVELLSQKQTNKFEFKIVQLSKNHGSLPALQAGISQAKGKVTVFLYADLQDPIELVGRLFDMYKKGFDITWACRNFAYDEKRFFSKLYAALMRKYAVDNFPENGYDVVMFTSQVRQLLVANPERNSSIFLQILSLGFNQTFIYYDKQERRKGKSKWNFARKLKLVVDSFVAFSYAPIRLVTIVGIVLAIVGFLWTMYIVAYTILVGGLPLGIPALISVSLIGFGVTNISLGIIAEYLWRTLDTSRGRKAFIIKNIIQKSRGSNE